MDEYNWTEARKTAKGAHRIFFDALSARWSVCDQSGRSPEETDDGVLWLDFSRPLIVKEERGLNFWLPLRDTQGVACATLTNVEGAAKLLEYFPDWEVGVDGTPYVTALRFVLGKIGKTKEEV